MQHRVTRVRTGTLSKKSPLKFELFYKIPTNFLADFAFACLSLRRSQWRSASVLALNYSSAELGVAKQTSLELISTYTSSVINEFYLQSHLKSQCVIVNVVTKWQSVHLTKMVPTVFCTMFDCAKEHLSEREMVLHVPWRRQRLSDRHRAFLPWFRGMFE